MWRCKGNALTAWRASKWLVCESQSFVVNSVNRAWDEGGYGCRGLRGREAHLHSWCLGSVRGAVSRGMAAARARVRHGGPMRAAVVS